MIAAEISWLRSKVHVLIMVADRWPDSITCKGTTDQQSCHPALRGLKVLFPFEVRILTPHLSYHITVMCFRSVQPGTCLKFFHNSISCSCIRHCWWRVIFLKKVLVTFFLWCLLFVSIANCHHSTENILNTHQTVACVRQQMRHASHSSTDMMIQHSADWPSMKHISLSGMKWLKTHTV